MPWKARGDREYFYESRRVNGKVEAVYRGTGPIAELAAAMVEAVRREREADREVVRGERREERAWQAERDEWVGRSLAQAAAAMRAAGFHRPDRGRWRKRRGGMRDEDALARLAEAPDVLGWGVDQLAVRSLADRYCCKGEDPARSHRNLRRQVRGMAEELAGPDPTPLVRLLATTVALAYAELRLMQTAVNVTAGSGHPIALADHKERSLDRAYKRFLKASKALADVRRIDPPTLVQINQHFAAPADPGPSRDRQAIGPE